MSTSMQNSSKSKERITFWIFAVTIILIWTIVGNSPSHKVHCTDKVIPYQATTVSDPTSLVGTSEITTYGANGVEHVCKNGNGIVTEDETTIEPITEVTSQGTREPIVYTPPVTRSTGCAITLCADGTCSNSTGRGTCSWHGGEAY